VKVNIVFFSARLATKHCLEVLDKYCRILAIVEHGPQLKPLPYLIAPEEFFPSENIKLFNHNDLLDGKADTILKKATLGVSFGYPRIIKPEMFKQPHFETINIHSAYLPNYRGRPAAARPIINGDSHIGITLHKMDKGIDTGDIIYRNLIPIENNDDMVNIHKKLYDKGTEQLEKLFSHLIEFDELPPSMPQDSQPSIFDFCIDWEDSAKRVYNTIRAIPYPWPMAYTFFKSNKIELCNAKIVEQNKVENCAQVLDITDDGIIVAAARDSVIIKKIRNSQGNWLEGKQISETLNIKKGDYFLVNNKDLSNLPEN